MPDFDLKSPNLFLNLHTVCATTSIVHYVSKTGLSKCPNNFKVHYKNADDPFQIVIVRDMWLTGFDAPSLHSMYVDKPMRGHGLMQAIARVNRVYGDKPGGLIVDYIGIAYHLKQALSNYTRSGGKGGLP